MIKQAHIASPAGSSSRTGRHLEKLHRMIKATVLREGTLPVDISDFARYLNLTIGDFQLVQSLPKHLSIGVILHLQSHVSLRTQLIRSLQGDVSRIEGTLRQVREAIVAEDMSTYKEIWPVDRLVQRAGAQPADRQKRLETLA